MRPLIKYRGGKSREIDEILPFIPDFNGRYIEPFFGGGALFFHLEPQRAIINDINNKLIQFYLGVRNDFDNLRNELNAIEHQYEVNRIAFENLKSQNPNVRVHDDNEDLYYQIRDMYNGLVQQDYSDALLYYFINKTAYSGMIRYNGRGEFNVPYGRYKHLSTANITQESSILLNRAEVFNLDFADIFDMANENDFIFLDPPYDCVFSDYGNDEYRDGFDEESHRRLAHAFFALPCPALLVIGRTPLTQELYGNNIVHEYAKNYAVNIRNRFRSGSTHILVSNIV